VVGDGPLGEVCGKFLAIALRERGQLGFVVPDDGAGAGRRVAAQVILDDESGDALAAHVDLDTVFFDDAAVDVGERDRAQGVFLGLGRAETLALHAPVGDGGAARDPADMLAVLEDRGALAGDAAAGDGDRAGHPGQVLDQRPVADKDALVGTVLTLEGRAADEVTLARRQADRERSQRAAHDRDLVPLRVETQLVAVERQACLETQGVAGAEPAGLGPRRHQRVPQGRRVLGGDEQLEAERLAGVSGTAQADLDGAGLPGVAGSARAGRARSRAQSHDAQLVAQWLRQVAGGEQTHEDLARRLALQSEHGDVLGTVLQSEVVEVAGEGLEVRPVLVAVGGIDDEHVLVVNEAVQVRVVDGPAGRGRHDRVLRLEGVERLAVVAEHVLEERDRAATADDEASHVRDVEQAGVASRGEMLGEDAGRIVQRHLPAREVDELRPGGDVSAVERRATQGCALRGHAAASRAAHCSAQALSLPRPSSMSATGIPE